MCCAISIISIPFHRHRFGDLLQRRRKRGRLNLEFEFNSTRYVAMAVRIVQAVLKLESVCILYNTDSLIRHHKGERSEMRENGKRQTRYGRSQVKCVADGIRDCACHFLESRRNRNPFERTNNYHHSSALAFLR
jgi:hypothetical protein